jgi:hypothetical protein
VKSGLVSANLTTALMIVHVKIIFDKIWRGTINFIAGSRIGLQDHIRGAAGTDGQTISSAENFGPYIPRGEIGHLFSDPRMTGIGHIAMLTDMDLQSIPASPALNFPGVSRSGLPREKSKTFRGRFGLQTNPGFKHFRDKGRLLHETQYFFRDPAFNLPRALGSID